MNDMDKMMKNASQKLGISQQSLQQSLKSGDVNQLLSNMKSEDAKKLKAMLQNKQLMEKLMKSPEAQKMMKNINPK